LVRKRKNGKLYPAIICQFSIMQQNKDEVEAFRNYWQERGAEVKTRPMLEWTASGSVRTETIDHDTEFRIACPWGNNTMAIHQNGDVVACAVDYEGRFKAGNVREQSLKEVWSVLWEKLRKPHRRHSWKDLPDLCKACGDWQTAGAQYESEKVPGTRPFWCSSESA